MTVPPASARGYRSNMSRSDGPSAESTPSSAQPPSPTRWRAAWLTPAFGAALAGGLAFELAPYRVAQSTGHLLGLVSFLLPGALLALGLGCAAILGFGDSQDLSDDAIGFLGLGLAGVYATLGTPVLRRRRAWGAPVPLSGR